MEKGSEARVERVSPPSRQLILCPEKIKKVKSRRTGFASVGADTPAVCPRKLGNSVAGILSSVCTRIISFGKLVCEGVFETRRKKKFEKSHEKNRKMKNYGIRHGGRT